jgi:hypothetical protein
MSRKLRLEFISLCRAAGRLTHGTLHLGRRNMEGNMDTQIIEDMPGTAEVEERVVSPAALNYDCDLQERIAVLAYALYELRERQHGLDVDDWLAAEEQVLGAREHTA